MTDRERELEAELEKLRNTKVEEWFGKERQLTEALREIEALKQERDLQDKGKAELFSIIERLSPELLKAIKTAIDSENKRRA
jgi:hypothetical protein